MMKRETKKNRRYGRSSQRGVTLLEAVLAIALLAIGIVGVAGLLGNVSAANRKSSFHNYSLDVFTELEAQIQNAACDLSPSASSTFVDPGLTAGGWVIAPVAGSAITFVGVIDATMAGSTSPVVASYNATRTTFDCPGPCTTPDQFQITVQVCDTSESKVCGPPPVAGYWVRTFQLTKACTIRVDDSGRGEYY
jgi:Tfp pilus assembly protein PilV